MIALVEFLALILRALLPALVETWKRESEKISESAAPDPMTDRLRRKVLEKWACPERSRGSGVAAFFLVLLLVGGCAGMTTIYVPSGEPVRLRETVKAAEVWVLDKAGKPTPGIMDLPEGWYCLPVPQTGER